jgi:hypothetical protein
MLYSEEGRKSTDRLTRVRGLSKIRTYSREPVPPSLDGDDSIIGDLFLLNEFIATFLRVENSAVLAIVRVSAILNESRTAVSSIARSSLLSAEVTLRGQVVTLINDGTSSWTWDGNYEVFHPQNNDSSSGTAVSKKSTLVELPACIVRPVRGQPKKHKEPATFTWKFEADDLSTLAEVLWDDIKGHLKSIPSRTPMKMFPCRGKNGQYD